MLLVACSSAPAQPAATSKPAATSAPKPSATGSPKPAGASPNPSPSPSPSAEARIQILDATLADATPWVSVRLTDGEPQIVSGWRLEVGDKSIVVPGNAIVQPGDTLTLRVGEAPSSDREVYLGADSYALALAATPGTRVRLVDQTGKVAAETTVPRF
jgi:hypothetical protein